MFEVAAELTGDERAACLQERCAGDESLRSEVESLLASDAQADGFIENPATSIPREVPEGMAEEPLGARQFGAYRTIREIGRGGLGTVYLAARSDAAYKKEVAIKLLRRGLDTDDILRRFRNERQILARLEHPNIARLIDGGMTEDGLPYFVMEYVEGEPLNAYCETRNLTTGAGAKRRSERRPRAGRQSRRHQPRIEQSGPGQRGNERGPARKVGSTWRDARKNGGCGWRTGKLSAGSVYPGIVVESRSEKCHDSPAREG